MLDIAKIDPNFAFVETNEVGLEFYSAPEKPFHLYGLLPPCEEEPYFHRMPADRAAAVSEKVCNLARRAAGGRIKFRTDSLRIAIRATYKEIYKANHFPLTGTAGFDLYTGTNYVGTFRPPYDLTDSYSTELKVCGNKAIREFTIHFPPYSTVSSLEIGLEADAALLPADGYRISLPIVYYGSSITQGGCVSRPGNSYQNILTRRFDCDHINLGFSGNARGEPAIADYMAELPMSAYVLDYDHNAPTPEHLEQTHWNMYHRIRQAHPDIPIFMMSRPRAGLRKEGEYRRRETVMKTYLQAKTNGDQNVHFVDFSHVLSIFGGDCGTVDGVHPNDLGFFCMAKALGDTMELVFREKGMIP